MADQQQPWAERTVEMPPEQQADPAQASPFRRGVASVGQPRMPRTESFPVAGHEPTGTGWPDQPAAPSPPVSEQLRQLRAGGEWSAIGGLFAFVCWGIWAISARGDLSSPFAAFVVTLLVAVGLFALARLLGRVVWERQFGRVRRSAKGAHLVAGLFLAAAGVAYLRQIQWVVDAWQWLTGN
jgi:hypothetical protein